MQQQKINIEIRKGLLEITAEPQFNEKTSNWSTFIKVTDFDVNDGDEPIEEFHYFDNKGESVIPQTRGYSVRFNPDSKYLGGEHDLNGYLAGNNIHREKEITIYSRGQALKKARMFNGKIEKVTRFGTTE